MQVETVVALEIGILYTDKQAYVASGPNIQQWLWPTFVWD